MKRSKVQEQADLFSNEATPVVLTALQHNRDELVDLISRLLWEVVQGPTATTSRGNAHEQDQR